MTPDPGRSADPFRSCPLCGGRVAKTVICSAEGSGSYGQHAGITEDSALPKDLTEVFVSPDTYHVSPEPMIMIADLHGALALCLHDENRGVGGLLHLRFMGGTGRPSDVTDNTLSSVLVVLDRFKRAVRGNATRSDEVQARIIAHALPATDAGEPSATIVDLIKADLADGKIVCGTQTMRRTQTMRVCFQPFEGRMWVCGPKDLRATRRALQSAG